MQKKSYIYQYIGCLMRFIPIFEPIFSLSGMWLLKPTKDGAQHIDLRRRTKMTATTLSTMMTTLRFPKPGDR